MNYLDKIKNALSNLNESCRDCKSNVCENCPIQQIKNQMMVNLKGAVNKPLTLVIVPFTDIGENYIRQKVSDSKRINDYMYLNSEEEIIIVPFSSTECDKLRGLKPYRLIVWGGFTISELIKYFLPLVYNDMGKISLMKEDDI